MSHHHSSYHFSLFSLSTSRCVQSFFPFLFILFQCLKRRREILAPLLLLQQEEIEKEVGKAAITIDEGRGRVVIYNNRRRREKETPFSHERTGWKADVGKEGGERQPLIRMIVRIHTHIHLSSQLLLLLYTTTTIFIPPPLFFCISLVSRQDFFPPVFSHYTLGVVVVSPLPETCNGTNKRRGDGGVGVRPIGASFKRAVRGVALLVKERHWGKKIRGREREKMLAQELWVWWWWWGGENTHPTTRHHSRIANHYIPMLPTYTTHTHRRKWRPRRGDQFLRPQLVWKELFPAANQNNLSFLEYSTKSSPLQKLLDKKYGGNKEAAILKLGDRSRILTRRKRLMRKKRNSESNVCVTGKKRINDERIA